MPTDKQIAANRLNAQNSTGPKSGPGKAISSRNALKTGIDISSELMRLESRAEFEQLEAEYYGDFTPANAIERALVDQLIRNEWLTRRYSAVESGVWNLRLKQKEDHLGAAFIYDAQTFLNLDRIRNSAQRNYAKALKELTALRKARNAAIPVREPEQTESLIPELGSFDTFPEPANPNPPTPTEIDQPDEEQPPIAA